MVKKFNLNDFEKGLKFIINDKKKLKLEKIKFIKREFNENNVLKNIEKLLKKLLMKIKFTNLYKLAPQKNKIFEKINSLIKNSNFIGGKRFTI